MGHKVALVIGILSPDEKQPTSSAIKSLGLRKGTGRTSFPGSEQRKKNCKILLFLTSIFCYILSGKKVWHPRLLFLSRQHKDEGILFTHKWYPGLFQFIFHPLGKTVHFTSSSATYSIHGSSPVSILVMVCWRRVP